jgi:hypothetical protein
MLLRSTYKDEEIKVAVNGDFYKAAGVSVGAQVSQGELVKTPDRSWQLLSVSNSNDVMISDSFYEGIISFQSPKSVGDSDTLHYPITSVNPDSIFDHQIAFFNRFYGSEIPKQKGFKNYVIEPITPWIVNNPIYAIITFVEKEYQDSVLSKDPWDDKRNASILSFDSTTFAPLSYLGVGDTITIQHTLTEESLAIYSAIGGNQRILTNGVFTGDWPERHPRTGVGIDYHSNHLYLITVDGRQETSKGMTLRELSDLMLSYGIDDAINLDGGGSSTMVIQGAVVNQPSDKTGERTVSNALIVVQRESQ